MHIEFPEEITIVARTAEPGQVRAASGRLPGDKAAAGAGARGEGETAKLVKAGKPVKAVKAKTGSGRIPRRPRSKALERQVFGLQEENTKLKQQFARWQFNAFAAGMTMQELDRPRARADRGQADE